MNYTSYYISFLWFLLEVKNGMFTSTVHTSPATTCSTSGQHFDGASFVGGIVLAIGIVAIGYVLWRYIQSKRQPGMTFNDI